MLDSALWLGVGQFSVSVYRSVRTSLTSHTAPMGVASAARAAGVPVVAVCGRTTLSPETLSAAGFAHSYALTDIESDTDLCMKNAGSLLTHVGALIGTRLATTGKEEENSYV